MPYAILRFQKLTGGASGRLEAHHEREKKSYASNPDINRSRSKDNYHLVTPKARYSLEINRRIQEAGCKTRKNSITFVDTFIGGTPEFMLKMQPAGQKEYFTQALEFMKKEVGEQNIISAIVHMDEKTPHMHHGFVMCKDDGSPLSEGHISRDFNKLITKHNLPYLRFHDLRHTAATNMHQLTGDFYTVGEILGHSLKGIGNSLGFAGNLEAVTERYVDVRLERKQIVLDRYHKAINKKKADDLSR